MFLLSVLAAGCGNKPKIVLPPPTPARIGSAERGTASWYGEPYHGRRTSNGEVYDMDGLTAAHLSLPFGTVVRIRNLSNDRSVDVRINDRGPFLKGRLIDVSREAARRIEMIGPGTTRVEVTVLAAPQDPVAVISPQPCVAAAGYAVQVGAFASRPNAQSLATALESDFPVMIQSATANGRTVHRVLVGGGSARAEAESLLAALRRDAVDGFLVPTAGGDCGA